MGYRSGEVTGITLTAIVRTMFIGDNGTIVGTMFIEDNGTPSNEMSGITLNK